MIPSRHGVVVADHRVLHRVRQAQQDDQIEGIRCRSSRLPKRRRNRIKLRYTIIGRMIFSRMGRVQMEHALDQRGLLVQQQTSMPRQHLPGKESVFGVNADRQRF